MITITAPSKPQLDPNFVPAILWTRAYKKLTTETAGSRAVRFAVQRAEGPRWIVDETLLPDSEAFAADNVKYAERLLKTLLWTWGGSRVRIAGAPDIVKALNTIYSPEGARHFDYSFMGDEAFNEPFTIEAAELADLTEILPPPAGSARALTGNRIGFDLGGSDRKCAAMIDGKVVFSEEIKWSPYHESDPAYHRAGIEDSLKRAAAHLPHVDGIGGSAAGLYIDNEARAGSLYRGISPADFKTHIQGIFKDLQKEWGGIPFDVANDGDVTAIAGAMAINDDAVLGISMGTSLAAGYINNEGSITGWINELAFVPIDYREDAGIDEWSGDAGCGVQYFSQQAVGRLLPLSGITVSEGLGLPEQLEVVQEKMAQGDERAAAIYSTIGTYFGYSIAYYAELYDFRHLLVLGRVSTGKGGDLILKEARRVLETEFPELSQKIAFQTPDEKTKRHGQAIAAASLPKI